MYWRRFAESEIPYHDATEFETWVSARWQEKEKLLEQYFETGLFPADEASVKATGKSKAGFVDTEVRLENWYEVGQIFVVPASLVLVADVISKLLALFFSVLRK